MDYIMPTLLIGIGVLGFKEHLELRQKITKQNNIISQLVENNNKIVAIERQRKEAEARRYEADVKLVEELKKNMLH